MNKILTFNLLQANRQIIQYLNINLCQKKKTNKQRNSYHESNSSLEIKSNQIIMRFMFKVCPL